MLLEAAVLGPCAIFRGFLLYSRHSSVKNRVIQQTVQLHLSHPVYWSTAPVHSLARACRQFSYIQDIQQTVQLDPHNSSATFFTPYRHQLESSKPCWKMVCLQCFEVRLKQKVIYLLRNSATSLLVLILKDLQLCTQEFVESYCQQPLHYHESTANQAASQAMYITTSIMASIDKHCCGQC